MKTSIGWVLLALWLLAAPAKAQSLAGVWQGVETDSREPGKSWPAELRLQNGKGTNLFGILYQEVSGQSSISATFQMQGTRTATGARLEHTRKLQETGYTPFSHWCEGSLTFTYDPNLEKLTGRATYEPVGDCDFGLFTLYRIKLKSAGTVAVATETTIRVSGRNVQWYADADRKQLLATGNAYRTKLSKATTFYLTQNYHPTSQSAVVPITIKVAGAAPAPKPAPSRPAPPPLPPDTARPAPLVAPTPVVLPTVLFRLGTPELLPEALPALTQLATELKARPELRLRVAGHTDKIGEPDKNQLLSEQRAEAVKAYLVQAGIGAERISTVGYGDTRPLYPSPDARNRRVEVQELKP